MMAMASERGRKKERDAIGRIKTSPMRNMVMRNEFINGAKLPDPKGGTGQHFQTR